MCILHILNSNAQTPPHVHTHTSHRYTQTQRYTHTHVQIYGGWLKYSHFILISAKVTESATETDITAYVVALWLGSATARRYLILTLFDDASSYTYTSCT